MSDNSTLVLDLQVHPNKLDAVISNGGTQPVRVWDRSNSWGWSTFSLEVTGSSQSQDYFTLTAKPRTFTRNGPGFTEIPAGGSHIVTLATGDDTEWDGLDQVEHLRREPLRVRAQLTVPPSPEAEELEVFVGEVNSPWRESQPPHLWLFKET